MLVTFRSKAWTSITMFGDVADTLLKMMGHSGTVPSAIRARDIPSALANLQRELASTAPQEEAKAAAQLKDKERGAEPYVELQKRAYPLIQMLAKSAEEDADVLWDEGRPVV